MARIAITSGATAGNKRRAATDYGTRDIDDKHPSQYTGRGGIASQVITFSYDDLPTFGLDAVIQSIPANAFIKSATLRVLTAFAGGASYNIGLYQADSTVIDADGIDAAVALTAIDAVGETVLCDGALVAGLLGIGAAAGQVVVAATGTFTAGKAVLTIEYTELNDRA
jgi:hypothetical protein